MNISAKASPQDCEYELVKPFTRPKCNLACSNWTK